MVYHLPATGLPFDKAKAQYCRIRLFPLSLSLLHIGVGLIFVPIHLIASPTLSTIQDDTINIRSNQRRSLKCISSGCIDCPHRSLSNGLSVIDVDRVTKIHMDFAIHNGTTTMTSQLFIKKNKEHSKKRKTEDNTDMATPK
jgi:hypothetical protein